MDFAFLNAITRSAHFPPLDPWLGASPAVPHPTINYYYFGYLIQALLLELSQHHPRAPSPRRWPSTWPSGCSSPWPRPGGLRPRLRPGARPGGRDGDGARRRPARLSPGTAESSRRYGRSAGGAARRRPPPRPGPPPGARTWSLRAPPGRTSPPGCSTAFLLLVAGNLWTALRLVDGSGMWSRDFWQGIGWNATRVLVIKSGEQDVDYTINEFPAFSFLLGDLHPHVLSPALRRAGRRPGLPLAAGPAPPLPLGGGSRRGAGGPGHRVPGRGPGARPALRPSWRWPRCCPGR